MSPSISTLFAEKASAVIRRLGGKAWRVVEAQHVVSTRKLVDSAEEQEILESLIDVSGHPLSRNLDDLHRVLTHSAITAPALWHMGSTSDVQASLTDLGLEEAAVPLWRYQVGAGLFAERRYLEAVEVLQDAEEHPVLFATARLFRIYALCLLSQVDEAKDLAEDTYPDLAERSDLDHWWDFLNEEYGVDPRSEASGN